MTNNTTGFGAFADDMRDFAAGTRRARRNVPRATDRAVEQITRVAFGASQRDVPVDTGELMESGEVYRRADGVWVIRYDADHALAIEDGSDPHVIEARDADALRFENQQGEVIYRVRVRHPGNDAQPFLGPNVDAQRERLPRALADALEDTLRWAYR